MAAVPGALRRPVAVLVLLLGVLSVHGVLEALEASGHAHPTTIVAVDLVTEDGGHHELAADGHCAACTALAAIASVLTLVAGWWGACRRHRGEAPVRGRTGSRTMKARAARRPPPALALLQVCLR